MRRKKFLRSDLSDCSVVAVKVAPAINEKGDRGADEHGRNNKDDDSIAKRVNGARSGSRCALVTHCAALRGGMRRSEQQNCCNKKKRPKETKRPVAFHQEHRSHSFTNRGKSHFGHW